MKPLPDQKRLCVYTGRDDVFFAALREAAGDGAVVSCLTLAQAVESGQSGVFFIEPQPDFTAETLNNAFAALSSRQAKVVIVVGEEATLPTGTEIGEVSAIMTRSPNAAAIRMAVFGFMELGGPPATEAQLLQRLLDAADDEGLSRALTIFHYAACEAASVHKGLAARIRRIEKLANNLLEALLDLSPLLEARIWELQAESAEEAEEGN